MAEPFVTCPGGPFILVEPTLTRHDWVLDFANGAVLPPDGLDLCACRCRGFLRFMYIKVGFMVWHGTVRAYIHSIVISFPVIIPSTQFHSASRVTKNAVLLGFTAGTSTTK